MQRKNILAIVLLSLVQFSGSSSSSEPMSSFYRGLEGLESFSSEGGRLVSRSDLSYHPHLVDRVEGNLESNFAINFYKSIKDKGSFGSSSSELDSSPLNVREGCVTGTELQDHNDATLDSFLIPPPPGLTLEHVKDEVEGDNSSNCPSGLVEGPDVGEREEGMEDFAVVSVVRKNKETINKKRMELYEQIERCAGTSIAQDLKRIIEPLNLETLVKLYEGKTDEVFSISDDLLKDVFGQEFLAELIKETASNFYNPDLAKVVNLSYFQSDISKKMFECLNEIIRSKLSIILHKFSGMILSHFGGNKDLIQAAFRAIYGSEIEVLDGNILIDGKGVSIDVELPYYETIKRVVCSKLFKRKKRPKSKSIKSVEEFMEECNKLLKGGSKNDSRKHSILCAYIDPMITNMMDTNIDYSVRAKAIHAIIDFLKKDEELFNSFFCIFDQKQAKVTEIALKLNKYLTINRSIKEKEKKNDHKRIVHVIERILNRLNTVEQNPKKNIIAINNIPLERRLRLLGKFK